MKVNQLGTLAMLGVVASFTVACGGGPTKPSAAIPSFGGDTSATSVKLTNFQEVAVDQMCTAKSVTYDDYGNEIPDASTAEAPATPPVVCDPPAASDQPQGEVVIPDPSWMDTARFAHAAR